MKMEPRAFHFNDIYVQVLMPKIDLEFAFG